MKNNKENIQYGIDGMHKTKISCITKVQEFLKVEITLLKLFNDYPYNDLYLDILLHELNSDILIDF